MMKFVVVLLFVLVCSISASPPEPKPEPEPSSSNEASGAPAGSPGSPETDSAETPVRGVDKPRCGIIFTKLFGNGMDGNGGYFNRRFNMGFGPSFTNERDIGRNGEDGGHIYSRRGFTPYFVLRGNRGNPAGRGGYNPNNDQPDTRDIEFVQS